MDIPAQPAMTPAEIELLEKHTPFGRHVLEFGSGGSSKFFLSKGVSLLVSVESDKNWLDSLAADKLVSFFHKKKRWLPIHGDIGPVGAWGTPLGTEPHVMWLNYHHTCWKLMPTTHFDLILVDGRFRIACFCQSLLHCQNRDVRFLVHDFWDREYLHVMLNHAEIVDRADRSVVLKKKSRTNWRAVCQTLMEHQFDQR